jgi:hypothetical protein
MSETRAVDIQTVNKFEIILVYCGPGVEAATFGDLGRND